MSKTVDVSEKTAKQLAEEGFCTHYPGYTCDKGWPAACEKCISRWLKEWRKANEQR